MNSFWASVAGWLRAYMLPVANAAAAAPDGITNLIRVATGSVNTPAQQKDIDAINALATIITNFESDLDSMSSDDIDLSKFLNLVPGLVTGLQTLFGGSQGLSAALVTPMLEYLEFSFLRGTAPTAYTTLGLIGVIDETQPIGNKINWTNLKYLFDPANMMKDVYGWGTSSFNGGLLLQRVANFAAGFGLVVDSKELLGPIQQIVDADAFNSGAPLPFVMIVPIFQRIDPATAFTISAGLVVIPVSGGSNPDDSGIALVPIGAADFGNNPLGPNWQIGFDAAGGSGYAVVFRPSGVQVAQLPAASASVDLKATLSSTWAAPPSVNLGGAFETSLQAIQVILDTKLQNPPTFSFGINVQGFQFNVDPGGADGFLQSVLPSGGLQGQADLGVIWSPSNGIQFSGGIGLQINIPVHLTIGPISLDEITIDGDLSGPPASLTLAVTVDAGATLGPIDATVEGIGIAAAFGIQQPSAGNPNQFGPFGVQIGFQPPSGLGLDIEAPAVSGGGFVAFDTAHKQYAGGLELTIEILQLKAFCVLDTAPVSFIIIISADFPPIELGFGFALSGVGGLIGVNRSLATDALRAAFRAHTLDSIVFLKGDFLSQAPALIQGISAIFPPLPGQFVIGPFVTITWGEPAILSAELGVIISLPDPVALAILGNIVVGIPDPDAAIILFNVDVLGTWDSASKIIEIDASIYDSYVAFFSVQGDMAFRLAYGDSPNFALSFGGLNPQYQPPPGFPTLARLSISLGDGGNPGISSLSYFAVTSNSLQFGAKSELTARAGGFGVQGFTQYDVLIMLDPFGFTFDISAELDVLAGGSVIMSIHLDGLLSGPSPWHIHGDARISFFLFSVSVNIDATFGQSSSGQTPPLISTISPFQTALGDARNWSATLPSDAGRVATFASAPPASGGILVHPLGQIQFHQTVVPLNVTFAKFGTGVPSDASTFTVAGPFLNNVQAPLSTANTVQDEFADGQFFTLSDQDKLSKPSYTVHDSGAIFTDGTIIAPFDVETDVKYQTFIENDPVAGPKKGADYQPTHATLVALSGTGASANSPRRQAGQQRYIAPGLNSAVGVNPELYVVVSALDLSLRPDIVPAPTGYYEAQSELETYVSSHPAEKTTLELIPAHELLQAA